MHLFAAAAICLAPLLAFAETGVPRIVVSNDNGWAELNIRTLFNNLVSEGHYVVLSAPADDWSDAGLKDIPDLNLTTPCQFDSCTAPAGHQGWNETSRRLNWVNNGPIGAMRYGMQQVGLRNWNNQPPNLAVVGIEIGSTLGGDAVRSSGNIAAACEAARPEPEHRHGSKFEDKTHIPAIAFSGATGSLVPFTTKPMPMHVLVYADLARRVVNKIVGDGMPYLPENTFLNVNFPESNSSRCTSSDAIKFVLSRIGETKESQRAEIEKRLDVEFKCGDNVLPSETQVLDYDGCYASISVGNATTKRDVSDRTQALIEEKLYSLLSCLPGWLE